MQNLSSYILLGIFILFAIGCEQAIRYERPEYESSPLVWAFLAADSIPQVVIHQTLPIQGWIEQDRDQQFLRDLQPIIRINGEPNLLELQEEKIISNLRSFRWGRQDSIILPFYEGSESISSGADLQLEFRHQDKTYSASSFIPQKVEIEKIEMDQEIITDIFSSFAQDLIRVYFKDNPEEDNSYRVRASLRGLETWPVFNDSTGELIREDSAAYTITQYGPPVLDIGQNGQMMFADFPTYHFQYNPFPVKFYLDSDGEKIYYQTLEIRLETMDRAGGLYLQSVEGQEQSGGDPLSEAVFLKGNIEGGVGIFSGMSVSDSIHFKFIK